MKNSFGLYQVDAEETEHLVLGISERLLLGSSAEADFCLHDIRASGLHALLERDSKTDEIRVIDLGSRFGTYLNGKRIQEATLKEGDSIALGGKEFLFRKMQASKKKDLPTLQPVEEETFKKNSQETSPSLLLETELSVLEVSLYWGDQLLEVKTFQEGSSIVLGSSKEAAFHLDLSSSGVEEEAYQIASYEAGQLSLNVPPGVTGLIWMGNTLHDIDSLRHRDQSSESFQTTYQVKVRQGDKADLQFGELSLCFRFIKKPAQPLRPVAERLDLRLLKFTVWTLGIYLLFFLILWLWPKTETIKTVKDVPKHLKRVLYQAGVKEADRARLSAVGELSQNAMGGRARSEEGKSASREKRDPKPEVKEKMLEQAKKSKETLKAEIQNINRAFQFQKPSESVSENAIESLEEKSGNTVSALTTGDYAYGSKGLGSGGGGESSGVGALKGLEAGGGMGFSDSGLLPSKGVSIELPQREDVIILGGLDPDVIAAVIKRYLPQIRYCYEQELLKNPTLKGKVKVGFTIIADGSVEEEKILETSLKHAGTEACILKRIAKWKFPKPRGGTRVGVKYPFLLMSNMGN